jgi:hypothetical protein
MNFPWGKAQVSRGEGHLPWGQCISPKKRPKFHWETYVPNLFAITIISFLFSYVIATYHWKGFEKNYNFVGGNIPIKIHM